MKSCIYIYVHLINEYNNNINMNRAEINTIISNGLDGGYWGIINSSKRQALQESAVAIEVAIAKGDSSDDAYENNNNSNFIKFKSPIVTPGE